MFKLFKGFESSSLVQTSINGKQNKLDCREEIQKIDKLLYSIKTVNYAPKGCQHKKWRVKPRSASVTVDKIVMIMHKFLHGWEL